MILRFVDDPSPCFEHLPAHLARNFGLAVDVRHVRPERVFRLELDAAQRADCGFVRAVLLVRSPSQLGVERLFANLAAAEPLHAPVLVEVVPHQPVAGEVGRTDGAGVQGGFPDGGVRFAQLDVVAVADLGVEPALTLFARVHRDFELWRRNSVGFGCVPARIGRL